MRGEVWLRRTKSCSVLRIDIRAEGRARYARRRFNTKNPVHRNAIANPILEVLINELRVVERVFEGFGRSGKSALLTHPRVEIFTNHFCMITDYICDCKLNHRQQRKLVTSVPLGMDIHQRIRIARNYAGLSLAEFADAVGVTYEAARSWEASESQPRPGRYKKIADATGTSESWIASGTGPLTTEETDDEQQKAEAFASAFLGLSDSQSEIILKLIEEFQRSS